MKNKNIKQFRMIGVFVAGLGLTVLSAQSTPVVPVFDYSGVPPANQPGGPYLLGLSFTVTAPITVNALGAFDNGGLGFAGNPVQVAIYEYSGSSPTPSLPGGSPLNTTPGNSLTAVTPIITFSGAQGNLPNQDQSEWSSITPETLGAGNYVVVASDYSEFTVIGNDDYNTGSSGGLTSPVGVNSAVSVIPIGIWTSGTTLSPSYTIVNDNSGNTGWGFDPELNGPYGPHPYPTYAAGTFSIPDGGMTVGMLGLVLCVCGLFTRKLRRA